MKIHVLGIVAIVCFFATKAISGQDFQGTVSAIQAAPDGRIYFKLASVDASAYCKSGWANLNMYIPKDHPEFFQNYALLLTSLAKTKNLYVANLELGNNGSAPVTLPKMATG